MRVFPALVVIGLVALSACISQQEPDVKQLLSCKCEEGVAKISETAKETTYRCDDSLCPGSVGFECWLRTCNYASIDKSTGEVTRFDGKCCEEPSGGPPSECASDSDCVPASCCHPNSCTARANAPDCSGIFCTEVCAPGTLDCGQGKCACDGGTCRADIWG